MLEDGLRSLFSKASFRARAQRMILILFVFWITLIGYQFYFTSEGKGAESKHPNLSQLGTHADLHDEQARIGKISILYGETKPYYERALQTHKRHNRQHGYPMFIQRVDVLDGYWTKPAFIHYMILRELRKPESQRLQWLFWFDADTIILNYNVPLEIFCPPQGDDALKKIDVLIADDWNGLNNGIFGIRVSRYSAELFAGILAFRDFEPDTSLPFEDQSAMENLLKRRKSVNRVAKVPQRWFNAYATEDIKPGPSWVHPGDLLVHFAGVGDRPTQMNKWADKSEKLSYKWNTPLTQTTYPEEIDRFWNRTKSVYDARMNHWAKETKHLQASFAKANQTITEWGSTSEKQSKNFLSMVQAQRNAVSYLGNITKYNNEIMKEDLYQLDKIVKELDDAHRTFSEDAAKIKAALEEQRKKKEEEEQKMREAEEAERRLKEEQDKGKQREQTEKAVSQGATQLESNEVHVPGS
ncbi:hypothetical protein E4U43_004008 [Claviceps pusilla]|uniref:Uncharacterized protein n=1 Tax=Claviceps pusilla TaxID=123648 RepID=A0A9P7SV02_9HYPO|nr:hypothetical protein E4U43_004008 [Claviceps pusilla]